ncbi:UDP-N-acetylmuramoyl-L-alanyl-D-glutamate synthetase [Corynebacterium aquilae DSM 44791]|uniref:UDP-N-acetylmuramoylalanine--D-glutamate ligase n=1 Tax=Corynebacterium aquilae DSM 44791 TaxID=1431546 RepID=A0A1L7CGV0_9CORY|nr:UDP-N-acetylmuramoyl-L-alanine--D-glutamate ligase [Corynebacterium aquilae]APT85090.1 UDP-N-acetylmuramoyl-L-alanyl-D-glutamate synthetase [Corynebacterium aquilae DSM 44791]
MSNEKFSQQVPSNLQGTVLVCGAGVSGAGCAHMLTTLGVDVVVADDNETALLRVTEATGARGIDTATAAERMDSFSAVVTSPGWSPASPLLQKAQQAGHTVMGDVELAWQLDQAGCFGAPRTWLVVTGTNGKTTTTAMLAAMMDTGQAKAQAVGNIGVAIGDALTAAERIDILVAEMSSFQLHWSDTLHPAAGVLLNIAEDHLDWHGGMPGYAAAKAKALTGDVAVVGLDCPAAVAQLERLNDPNTTVVGFTLGAPAEGQLGVVDGMLYDNAFGHGALCSAAGISPPGPAGVSDALAAAAVALSQSIPPADIVSALESFEVSQHRGQIVHSVVVEENLPPIVFIDNSKATNPHAADQALAGHDKLVWVAGGQLKGAEVAGLVRDHAHRLLGVSIIGVDAPLIAAALDEYAPDVPYTVVATTDPAQAMDEAMQAALRYAQPGAAVVLAPAAASLDMYTGMSQRGDMFAHAARALTATS